MQRVLLGKRTERAPDGVILALVSSDGRDDTYMPGDDDEGNGYRGWGETCEQFRAPGRTWDGCAVGSPGRLFGTQPEQAHRLLGTFATLNQQLGPA